MFTGSGCICLTAFTDLGIELDKETALDRNGLKKTPLIVDFWKFKEVEVTKQSTKNTEHDHWSGVYLCSFLVAGVVCALTLLALCLIIQLCFVVPPLVFVFLAEIVSVFTASIFYLLFLGQY
ncbi:MAG TPA: hypothetical protein VGF79_11940 [Bacteroidia bacterium]